MRYLITGGAGFIGSNFIRFLSEKYPDCEVVNLDKLTYAGNLENLASLKPGFRYSFVQGDICDSELADKLVRDCDIVVHFAAETHVDRSVTGPEEFVRTNVGGTLALLEAARKFGKRFHHISTDEVFGSLMLDSSEKFSETSAYDPSSPYSASKAGADHLVRSYVKSFGLKATISNCSNNYGPYHFPEKLIPLAITNILEGKKVPVYGEGNQVRDWLYVADHCSAIDLILQKGKIGETYCIGGLTNDVTNLEVIKKIIQLLGASDDLIEFVKDRPGHDVKYAVDWSKIKTELGWKPQHDLNTGLAQTVEWYKHNESWWKKIKSGEYQNYYSKQYANNRI